MAGLILLTSVAGLRLDHAAYKNHFIDKTFVQVGNKRPLAYFDFSNMSVNAQVNSNNDRSIPQPLNTDSTSVISGKESSIDALNNDSILDKA